MTTWYGSDISGCTKGTSWLTLHEVVGNNFTQVQGLQIGTEPVTSPVIAGGRIYVVGSEGALNITAEINTTISEGPSSPRANVGVGVFEQLSWTELE